MSNIRYITTKNHVKSYDIDSFLNKINKKRFKGLLSVLWQEKWEAWEITHPTFNNKVGGFEIMTSGAKQLSSAHPHDFWMKYVQTVFFQELGKMTNGLLWDESEPKDKYKPTPKKYSSFEKWLTERAKYFFKGDKKKIKKNVREYMILAPRGLKEC